jgi:hypothetical protein
MARLNQSIDQSPRVQMMARLQESVNLTPHAAAQRRQFEGLRGPLPPLQRVIAVKTGERYASAAELPGPLAADHLLSGFADSPLTALSQSAADLDRHAAGDEISILTPHRHLIGERHDDSHYAEAVAAWGWGAAKMREGFQTSGTVRDPYTQSWLHPGFLKPRAAVGTLPLEDVHARMLQDIALYRARLVLLSQGAQSTKIEVARNTLSSEDKADYDDLRANAEEGKGGLLMRVRGYEEACAALLPQDPAGDTGAQTALRYMGTVMDGNWDELRDEMKSVAASPWNLVMADSGDFGVANRLTQKSMAATALIGRLDNLAALTVAVLKAEANNPPGTSNAADQAVNDMTGGVGTALTQISPLRELFMRQRIDAMPKPGLVGMGVAHVDNLNGQITDGAYHRSYRDFNGAIQMKTDFPGPILQARWRNATSTMASQADLQAATGVAPGTIDPGSAADVSLISGTDYLVAPNAELTRQAATLAVNALPDGKHIVGESVHGAADWTNATASWPYIPRMLEGLKSYEKPGEAGVAAADQRQETRLRAGSTDLALEGHNEYAITTLTVLQQYLKGYDLYHDAEGPGAARHRQEKFQELHEWAQAAHVVLQRLREIGVVLADKPIRTRQEEQYLQLALHIDFSEGYKQIEKIATDNPTGYVTTLGGYAEKIWSKNVYLIQDLVNDVVRRIIALDDFQNMASVTALNAGRDRDLSDWEQRGVQAIAGPASRDIRETEMVRRINAGPSPLLVKTGKEHIPGLRTKGAAGTLHDDELSFRTSTAKTTDSLGIIVDPVAPPGTNTAVTDNGP